MVGNRESSNLRCRKKLLRSSAALLWVSGGPNEQARLGAAEAKREGWFEAILLFARRHPRAIRTMEYADHWDEVWGSQLPDPYPSFDEWRSNADSYIEPPSASAHAVDS